MNELKDDDLECVVGGGLKIRGEVLGFRGFLGSMFSRLLNRNQC